MAGWTPKHRKLVEATFYQFLNRATVNSKDYGPIILGEHLFAGQKMFITAVFDALEDDIHKIFVLKSRQLGLSTISRALTVFLIGIHKGVKGALVLDTDNNKNEARSEIETMIQDLPTEFKFPVVKSYNRTGITLSTNSKILFMSAGVRASKTSGTLGRSVGLSIAHCSELCSWDNPEGLEAFDNSLSDVNPDRLYIYESTARGYNDWHDMWKDALNDPAHCKCVFLGWWSKDSQKIDKDHPDFDLYGRFPVTAKEAAKIETVREKYGVEVTPEQLAWVRRKMDPSVTRDSDADPTFEGSNTRIQEQPWDDSEAFQQTGAVFFSSEVLTELTNKYVSNKYQPYMYSVGAEFADMRIFKADNLRSVELKVWEEPDSDGVYCIGIDPAFGASEKNDRSCAQVFRCYSDGMDQVAEYAWPLMTTRHLAWAIASLLGWYGIGRAEVRYILEINGPGEAVFAELKALKQQIENGYKFKEIDERGLRDIFRNARTYIYSRTDSMGVGFNYHFKTNQQTKVLILERLRDFVSNGMLRIRSLALVEEMKSIARDGDSISAPSSKRDDRVLAAAFAAHYWATKIRPQLIVQKRSRESEAARKRLSIVDQVYLFQQNQLSTFFDAKRKARTMQLQQTARQKWRYGR